MKFSMMKGSWEGAVKSNQLLLVSNLVLAGLLAMSVGSLLNSHERVVLMPPHVDTKMSVEWKSASSDYLKSFGLYFATLVGNVTPKNLTFVSDVLSPMVSPRIYPEVRKKLIALSEDPVFRNTAATVLFEGTRVIHETGTNKVFVLGVATTRDAMGAVSTQEMVYELVIEIEEGRPVIQKIDTYDGHVPRTVEWLQANPQAVKKEEVAK